MVRVMATKTNELPLHITLALSQLHAAIDRWDKWRKELYAAIADVNAHAANKEMGMPWPPTEEPKEMQKALA